MLTFGLVKIEPVDDLTLASLFCFYSFSGCSLEIKQI